MKRILFIITVSLCLLSLSSCKKQTQEVVTSSKLEFEMVAVSATSAKIAISYSEGEPYYIRVMKAEPLSSMSYIDMEDKDELSAFINTHSFLSSVPATVVATGLENLEEYVCGAVAFNIRNEIIGVNYIKFVTAPSEDAIGDDDNAGKVDVVVL